MGKLLRGKTRKTEEKLGEKLGTGKSEQPPIYGWGKFTKMVTVPSDCP